MKKNIGVAMGLYPAPLVVVGATVNEKPTWTLAAHLGIMGHDGIIVSLSKRHYINKGIRDKKYMSINIVDKPMLKRADYTGCVSGAKTDKSNLFLYSLGSSGAPLIDEAPLSMDCSVTDIYETEGFDNFICKINSTYAEEAVLTQNGKIDYRALKPVLFQMPTYEYLITGDVIGKCMKQEK